VLRRIESRNAKDTAHRVLQDCGRIFRYAIATSRADRDPARDLAGALALISVRHYASIVDPKGVGALMRSIEVYTGSFVTKCALRLAALLFVRPGELKARSANPFILLSHISIRTTMVGASLPSYGDVTTLRPQEQYHYNCT